jgi:hypothetical protein
MSNLLGTNFRPESRKSQGVDDSGIHKEISKTAQRNLKHMLKICRIPKDTLKNFVRITLIRIHSKTPTPNNIDWPEP